jgi:hypothetical protein
MQAQKALTQQYTKVHERNVDPHCYTNRGMDFTTQTSNRSTLSRLCAALALLAACSPGLAQTPTPPAIPPSELVRLAVANEVAAANNTAVKHMFRSHKQTPKGSQTKLYVETNDAIAAMLIAMNDQPLTQEQQQGEINHLAWLAGSPEQLRKKKAREKEDADRTLRIVKALPDAFQYEYVGTENGEAGLGRPGAPLVRLKFTPNPEYSPPTRVEEVLAGLQGYLLIDPEARRLARIDGTLFRNISFGWGIVGHLDKGGHFRIQQAESGDGTWDITGMSLNITGRILLFKSLSMVSDEVFSDFQRVPDDLSFAKGADLLKAEQEKLAHNSHTP